MPSVGTGAGQIFSDIGLYKGVVVASVLPRGELF